MSACAGRRRHHARLLIVCTGEPYLIEPRPPKAGNSYAAWVRVRLGRLTLAVFVVLQIADGLMTFGAVQIFGTAAEGNPILETWIQLAGPGATLLGAKGIACGGAAVLYACGRKKTLAALTVGLLAGAVVPWLALLATFP
jgi:hypothetical protein